MRNCQRGLNSALVAKLEILSIGYASSPIPSGARSSRLLTTLAFQVEHSHIPSDGAWRPPAEAVATTTTAP